MPLLFDMPLEQLEHYHGRNPRPADFDEYWERALAELATTEPAATTTPATFSAPFAECLDLTFTGTGGARIYAKLLRPRAAADGQPVVLKFHGYGANSGDWFDSLPWAAAGFTVAAMDCRGQGGRSEDVGGDPGPSRFGHIVRGLAGRADQMLYRHLFLDTAQLARVVAALPGVDPARMAAIGASQGGGLALACAALYPDIQRTVAVHPFLCDYQRVWEIDQARNAYAELSDYFRRFDPRHERAEAVWTRLGYIDVQHLAPRIQADVLLVVSLMDQTCPPSTQFAAYNKITAPKRTLLYPDYAHEWMPDLSDIIFQHLNQQDT
jgi:cephalosporin-C deacetylase